MALFHFYGWKGLIAFPFIVLAGGWLGKVMVGKLFKTFALGLFSAKAKVLRGAELEVHSVTPVPKPPELEDAEEEDEDAEAGEENDGEGDETEGEEAEDAESEESEEEEEPEGPKEYFEVNLTITPRGGYDGRVWEPGELMLTSAKISSLADLEHKTVGTAEQVQIWSGTEFQPDDECKYPGEQRLKITFATNPGGSRVWLHYYNEPLGMVDLPPWKPAQPLSGAAGEKA